MKYQLLLLSLLLSFGFASAQQLEMIEFKETTELSAAQYREYDANQNACALIKLGLIANDPVFEGSVVKSENKGGVYWLYIPQGTTKLTIQSSNFLPLRVEFPPVKSLFTYHMTVAPKGGNPGPGPGPGPGPEPQEGTITISIPALPSVNVGGQTVDQGGPVDFNMVLLKHGRFEMGATPEQNSSEKDETPVHYVTITRDYYIGETEVTQALWERIMGNNPSAYKSPNNPVENITYNDAFDFCRKLSQLTKKTFRLPTEAEWCEDYKQDYTPGDKRDPVCLKRSDLRVRRGGAWECPSSEDLRVAFRRKMPEKDRNNATGLRIVMEADD